ncbi:MAG TPA: hypothetical protein VJ902_05450 [Wenzhouxiangellaceae bacterium]|nr:hypothetical protein [Wenzhouxiangellaceae bacterium]HKL53371.1 hypothetical protein [Wenzhouxiangellaceae bacterium]HKL53384.1 hypothetical protein [Wenzhouxiangellaceae bacterium]
MHKSPDPFERDLERENALEDSRTVPREPELAADWALKRELVGLGAAELPVAVKTRLRRNAHMEQRGPWLMGIAAALVVAVVVAAVLQSPTVQQPPTGSQSVVTPTARDLAELQFAFDTINRTGKRAAAKAGREVQQSLVMPDLGLSELPYAGYVRPYFERPDRSG